MKLPLFESQLDQALASGQIAGAILLAADDNGVIYQNPAGRRGIDQDAPMDLDTVVWYASMTKAVTAACAMQLVEQGKLSLDAPAAKVLPELDGIQVMEGFDAEGK
ncbi:MAG: serine hydrolase domain-containing protein, partial [Panacagrimonas sp.]